MISYEISTLLCLKFLIRQSETSIYIKRCGCILINAGEKPEQNPCMGQRFLDVFIKDIENKKRAVLRLAVNF